MGFKAKTFAKYNVSMANHLVKANSEVEDALKNWVNKWKSEPLSLLLKNKPEYFKDLKPKKDMLLERGLVLEPKDFSKLYHKRTLPARSEAPFESWAHRGHVHHEDHLVDHSHPGDFLVFFSKKVPAEKIILCVSDVLQVEYEEHEVLVEPLPLHWGEISWIQLKSAMGGESYTLSLEEAITLIKEMEEKKFDLEALDPKWGIDPRLD